MTDTGREIHKGDHEGEMREAGREPEVVPQSQ